MANTSKNGLLNRWYPDLLCLIIIVGINPITHFFNRSPRIFSPDTITYITLGRDLFAKGLFYVPSWCHVNNGLIYPILYPFFIACGNFFSTESLKVAEWVSCLSALAASIPIFLYLKETTNRVVALLTVFLIQINFYYFSFGMRPLSEATFLLTLSCTLVLTLRLFRHSEKSSGGLPLFLGLSCALAFLSRQIGIIVLIFLIGFFLLHGLISSRTERGMILKSALFMVLGWLILVAPYTIIIYYQTGHHPLQQNFSMARHEVITTDPEVLEEIRRIESIPDKSYDLIYAKRRLMRKLLPDASEMLNRVDRKKREKAGLAKIALTSLKGPKEYMGRIYHNAVYLREPLGSILLYLFVALCISPFFVKSENVKLLNRLLLPLFIVFYLLALSCVIDKIPRYIYILFPFALMQIAGELFICFHAVTNALRIRFSSLVFFFLIYAFFLLVTPHFFTELRVFPKLQDVETRFESLRKNVNREPVFSLTPFGSYVSGGSCRLLPNDSLEKVVTYGKKTGVRWLLVTRTESALSEIQLYNNAQWYRNPSLDKEYPHLVRYCCATSDGGYTLYEIL
jgi:4-amino-4-deoxy-L-arabinose transferase-like glycosyltransferase